MTNDEPGVMQLGQLETEHGGGACGGVTLLTGSDFKKYSWR